MAKYRVLLCFFISLSISAEDKSNEDLYQLSFDDLKNVSVSSVDFTNRSLTESFASAHVITSDMIENLPMFTLGDYFEMLIPGVVIFSQGTNGAGLAARGITRRVQKLWDGHSINRLTADGSSLYFSPLLNDIEQVEVVLGPGSVKHGTGALGGYLNFVPKNGNSFQGKHVDLDYGTVDNSQRLQMQYGNKYGVNRDIYFYAGFFQADGFSTDNDFGGATSPSPVERRKFANRDEITAGNYEPSYKFSLNWNHERFNLKSLFEHTEFNPGGLVTDFDSLNNWTLFSVQPKYTFQLPGKSSFELSSSLQLNDKSRVRESISQADNSQKTGGRESTTELKGTYQTKYFEHHELAIGAQIKWLDINSRKHYFSSDPTTNRSFVDGNWREYSVFVEDNFSLSDKATVVAGLRYDASDYSEDLKFDGRGLGEQRFRPPDLSNVSPRVAFIYKTDNDYVFRAVYQEGFSFPAIIQYPRFFVVNNVLESQGLETLPNRTPEILKNFELGIRGDLIKNTLSFDLAVYYNRFEDRNAFVNINGDQNFLPPDVVSLLPDSLGGLTVAVDDDIDAYGGDITLSWTPNNNIVTNLSYAYSVPDHISTRNNELTLLTTNNLSEWLEFPKHQVKADISVQHNEWLFTLAGIYQSGLTIDNRFAPDRENAADEFVRFNAGINYRLNERSNISLLAKNIFGNNTPRINGDPNRPWQGSLGSDERLIYLGFNLSF